MKAFALIQRTALIISFLVITRGRGSAPNVYLSGICSTGAFPREENMVIDRNDVLTLQIDTDFWRSSGENLRCGALFRAASSESKICYKFTDIRLSGPGARVSVTSVQSAKDEYSRSEHDVYTARSLPVIDDANCSPYAFLGVTAELTSGHSRLTAQMQIYNKDVDDKNDGVIPGVVAGVVSLVAISVLAASCVLFQRRRNCRAREARAAQAAEQWKDPPVAVVHLPPYSSVPPPDAQPPPYSPYVDPPPSYAMTVSASSEQRRNRSRESVV